MKDGHVSLSAVRLLGDGKLPQRERAAVLAHLLSGCEHCRGLAGEAWTAVSSNTVDPAQDLAPLPGIGDVMSRVRDREGILERERAQAPGLVAQLLNHPQGRRATIVSNSRRFHTWGVAELLLDYYLQEVFSDPTAARGWAELALLAAERLDSEAYGARLVSDLQARAATSLGNAWRASSDHIQAEDAFRSAETRIRRGTGDPLDKARLCHLRGLLRKAERRFEEAGALYRRAAALYRRAGDDHSQGKVLLDAANLLSQQGNLEGAMTLRHRAIAMLKVEREPRLVVVAEHNMIDDLVEAGRPEEALARLERLRPLYATLNEALTEARLHWVEGKQALQLGKHELAEDAFRAARETFMAREIPYDAAVVNLELANVYAEQGRTADMKRLAAEMLPIFQSLGIHREAIAAVLVFQRAAEMEAVTAGLIKELAAYFQRASKEPGLRFRAPG